MSDLLPGLISASYRGIGFDMPDTRTEPGRRVQRHLFPGRDSAAYDDFGKRPRVVSIEGVILGDDYIAKANAMASAFEMPGPARLMHPWLGPMRVILLEPGEISFSSRELRLARFTATFERFERETGKGPASPIRLPALIPVLADAAIALIRAASSRSLSSIGPAAARRSSRVARRAIGVSGGQRSAARIALAAIPNPVSQDAEAFAGEVTSIAKAVLAATPALTAGPLGRAFEAPSPQVAIEAFDALTFFLDLADGLLTGIADAPSLTDRAMIVGAAAHALSSAAQTLVHVPFETKDTALTTRSSLLSVASSVAAEASRASSSALSAEVATLTSATEDIGVEAARDLNEIIGRLPRLLVLDRRTETDAFALAHHLVGDDPSAIEATYRDIVARNRPRHPARIQPGRIETVRR